MELARTRITGFPWDQLGITQVDNIPLARLATVTGVYGLSFEIMLVNVALAVAFLVRRGAGASNPAAGRDAGGRSCCRPDCWSLRRSAHRPHGRLVQANIPILEGADWTTEYFDRHAADLTRSA